jgi:hypothetical protein
MAGLFSTAKWLKWVATKKKLLLALVSRRVNYSNSPGTFAGQGYGL